MAFEQIAPEVTKNAKYWNPEMTGESIEGHVYDDAHDKFGNRLIVLDRGEDENGNVITTTLPGHRNLTKYYSKIKNGDYIRVTLIDVKQPKKEGNRPYKIYKVEIDPSRFKEYNN